MKKVSLYSSSSNQSAAVTRPGERNAHARVGAKSGDLNPSRESASPKSVRRLWRRFQPRYRLPLWATVAGLVVLSWVVGHTALAPPALRLTQDEVDAAVLHTLNTKSLPSPAAKAYDVIKPSVVRVRSLNRSASTGDVAETSIGSGVVIVDNGIILTSLHVVANAERVSVVFQDGSESDASVIVKQPEQDLAVLWATALPDNLVAATMRSTQDLAPGEQVIAVGFPFGIGPSVTAGVVSGLRRERRSMSGEHIIGNLIQFDAAVNPGSSGGPLATTDGEIIGIVTSILNPSNDNFFVGIGFAVPIENAAAAAGTSPF